MPRAAAALGHVNLLLAMFAGAGLAAAGLGGEAAAAALAGAGGAQLLLAALAQAGLAAAARRTPILSTYMAGMLVLVVAEVAAGVWLGARGGWALGTVLGHKSSEELYVFGGCMVACGALQLLGAALALPAARAPRRPGACAHTALAVSNQRPSSFSPRTPRCLRPMSEVDHQYTPSAPLSKYDNNRRSRPSRGWRLQAGGGGPHG